ncbi:hypothetical protein A3D00_03045 [Candidatus Woesebacteria bacterium RIFCSPHIGHO2_02_FULL_38_9]|uniref:AAA+ ATPase domain-containing protein n=1 Tax=Candidatus Woesebacteria bacterium RIFCSPHIGHO2_01_FULL_39_28 TaxID=1802496 RepID=A0A1F7YEV0_9BACT|nr:MAG: hypothetical protein A2627_02775 [Candidatus Woesebacteria bacterium RIFCSPHIGHO2_01_FULL_39_28]OGM34662.1 MAG: hypothetical protein A3D00_03045 [Candidatus Woesebacteria bacterium RIFCSPHIGHO2_02_FULL_38_9]OGM58590.1 MAG: hypothetical protein A3A50_00915 [Candidatus Woesebacteria bacterium RIFCSPLOWO2_01_FULL_38_20]
MLITRSLEKDIAKYLRGNTKKILFIWGPRRSGKTTLLKKISEKLKTPIFNFDLLSARENFVPREENLKKLISEHKIILIDEVQSYPESTLALKILTDQFNAKIIATGSSELRKKSQDFDTLTGRYIESFCLPLSIEEVKNNSKTRSYQEEEFLRNLLEQSQIFGLYPEIFSFKGGESQKIELLENILDSYVIKDIVDIYNLKNAKLAKDILTKIALQLGSEVSIREIAGSLSANVETVANYIEIFIKNYILIPLPSFKTNLRRAVSENRKLFFYDLGIRNALVKDFREVSLRPDKGGVFENFILSEIEKSKRNHHTKFSSYFYREYSGKEVDLVVEDYKKNYISVEIKYSSEKAKRVFPLTHQLRVINSQNYFERIKELQTH